MGEEGGTGEGDMRGNRRGRGGGGQGGINKQWKAYY